MKSSFKPLIAALALIAPLASHAAANLVVNGSFENPGVAADSWAVFPGLPGWAASSSGVEIRNQHVGTAFDGANFAELDTHGASSNSWISQTIGTVANKVYSLSYYFAPRMGTDASTNDISVSWNGGLLTTNAGADSFTGDHSWVKYTFKVTGTGTDTLMFAAGGKQDTFGGSLDHVMLTAVPEPQTYALMLAGLGAVGFLASRRKAAR